MSRIRFKKAFGTIRGGTVHSASPHDAAHYIKEGLAVLEGIDHDVQALLKDAGWKPRKTEAPPATPEAPQPQSDAPGTPLPSDFPAHGELVAAGYGTLEAVAEATDDELTAIKGIGKGTLARIREQ